MSHNNSINFEGINNTFCDVRIGFYELLYCMERILMTGNLNEE
jgi:hypothetical protein